MCLGCLVFLYYLRVIYITVVSQYMMGGNYVQCYSLTPPISIIDMLTCSWCMDFQYHISSLVLKLAYVFRTCTRKNKHMIHGPKIHDAYWWGKTVHSHQWLKNPSYSSTSDDKLMHPLCHSKYCQIIFTGFLLRTSKATLKFQNRITLYALLLIIIQFWYKEVMT